MKNIALTPEHEKLIDDQIRAGLYNSASEVVAEALRLLEVQGEFERIKYEALKRDIAAGIEQLDRGDVVSAEEVFAEPQRDNRAIRRKTSRRKR
jgi:antitoxin ParD1/3/4